MIALLDTGYSNLRAYRNVLNYINKKYEVIEKYQKQLSNFDTILLPGVSSFGPLSDELCRRELKSFLLEAHDVGKKIIGTCSGMQIMFDKSEEDPGTLGLGMVKGEVCRFPYKEQSSTNVGWKESKSGTFFYVHSYYCQTQEAFDHVEYTEFNEVSFVSEFRLNNVFGFQYHPEKSGLDGVEKIKSALNF